MTDHETLDAEELEALRERRDALLRENADLESERNVYRDLYEFAPDCYGLLDAETVTVLECNREMVRVLGYDRDEIVGAHMFKFHPQEIHGLLTAMVEQFRETGEVPEAELEFLCKDGRRILSTARVSAIRDDQGRLVRARSVMRDITRYEQTRSALRESEERFRMLAETIDMIPWEAELSISAGGENAAELTQEDPLRNSKLRELLRVTYMGPQCKRVVGFTQEECAIPGFWLDAVHIDDRAYVVRQLSKMLTDATPQSIEYRIVGGDGRTRFLRNHYNVVHKADGTFNLSGILIDMTDRKLAAEGRERLIRELNHRVKNTLAVVEGLAIRSAETDSSFDAFKNALSSRVRAMARTHAAASKQHWLHLDIKDLVGAACGKDSRLKFNGPALSVTSELAQPLAMALHELAANARKHGALSRPPGSALLSWAVTDESSPRKLRLEWTELDGPAVPVPGPRGYGLYVIEELLAYEVDAAVTVSFAEPGLRCTIAIPLLAA